MAALQGQSSLRNDQTTNLPQATMMGDTAARAEAATALLLLFHEEATTPPTALRPHSPFSPDEDVFILAFVRKNGKQWAWLTRMLGRRSENAVRNRWTRIMSNRPKQKYYLCRKCGIPKQGHICVLRR